MTEPFDWSENEDRLDIAIAEAAKSSGTWQAACIAAAISLGASEKEARDDGDWSSYVWHDTPLFSFATVHIAGSSWSLWVRELCGHEFLISSSDEPFTEHIWASWSPPRDQAALDRAVRDAWRDHWSDIPLPPAFSGADVLWEGPKENYQVAHRNLDAVLVADDRAWATFKERMDDVVEGMRYFAREGVAIDSLGGNTPRPAHDLTWLETITAGPFLDGCRQDDVARQTLVSYFLMA